MPSWPKLARKLPSLALLSSSSMRTATLVMPSALEALSNTYSLPSVGLAPLPTSERINLVTEATRRDLRVALSTSSGLPALSAVTRDATRESAFVALPFCCGSPRRGESSFMLGTR